VRRNRSAAWVPTTLGAGEVRGVLHARLQRRSQVLSTATVVERPPESFWVGLSCEVICRKCSAATPLRCPRQLTLKALQNKM
jgi:hypothetical protein